jgi:hypothetical protein
VGHDGGEGYNVNLAWEGEGLGDHDYLAAFQQVLVPIAEEYGPDLIIVSAGFDAAQDDPIGCCNVTPHCYGQLTQMLMNVAPVVLVLEGGYNLRSTAESTEACVRVLVGEPAEPLPSPVQPSSAGLRGIATAKYVQSQFWNCVIAPEVLPYGGHSWQQMMGASLMPPGWLSSEDDVATPAGTRLGQPGRGSSRQGGSSRRQPGSGRRQIQLLRAIHQAAIRAFWRRRQQLSRRRRKKPSHSAAAKAATAAAAAAVAAGSDM